MKRLIGVFLILVSIWGFIYLGGKILFFDSILQIKGAIEAGWVVKDVVKGLVKIFILCPSFEISTITLFILGRYLLND